MERNKTARRGIKLGVKLSPQQLHFMLVIWLTRGDTTEDNNIENPTNRYISTTYYGGLVLQNGKELEPSYNQSTYDALRAKGMLVTPNYIMLRNARAGTLSEFKPPYSFKCYIVLSERGITKIKHNINYSLIERERLMRAL